MNLLSTVRFAGVIIIIIIIIIIYLFIYLFTFYLMHSSNYFFKHYCIY